MRLYQTKELIPSNSKQRVKFICSNSPLRFICQTSTVVIVVLKRACAFFLTQSVIDRCQNVTDTGKKMFQSLFGSLITHLFYHKTENN